MGPSVGSRAVWRAWRTPHGRGHPGTCGCYEFCSTGTAGWDPRQRRVSAWLPVSGRTLGFSSWWAAPGLLGVPGAVQGCHIAH